MLDTGCGTLVGRTAELDRMRKLLGDAEAGQPVVMLVSGDAGVGKTRLILELTAEAAGRGFTTLSGRCAELAETIPYLPLADALRSADTSRLAEAVAARPVLAGLLPDREITRQPGDLPGVAQQQLFGAVLGMLTELAEISPVLLVLEDLHWADRSTRDLVSFLSRVLHTERIALVLTYRSDDMHRSHPLRPLVAELQRLPQVTAIEIGPLDPAAMAQHLTQLAGRLPDTTAISRVIERAEGNPYFAEELLASSSVSGDLPSGLADLLVARTIGLSDAAQQVLRAAAVSGRRIDDELVMRAAGLTVPEYEPAVREAAARQLLVADGRAGLAFRHALLREAIYNDLLPGERTRLHARFAELLSERAEPGTAAELAMHCLASHDIPGAFAASVRAGEEAWQLAAPAEAYRHFDQALALWERVDGAAELSGMSRGRLAFKAAESTAETGQLDLAVRKLRRLAKFLEEATDTDPRLLTRVKERLAFFLLDIDQDEEAIAVASAAVDVLPPEPPTWERAGALATHARTLMSLLDTTAAKARAMEADVAAAAANAPWLQADALATLSMVSERAGLIPEAKALTMRALELASSSDRTGVDLRVRTLLARLQFESGDLAAAAHTAHVGAERAAQAGLSLAPYGSDLQFLHYLAHYADGGWEQAQKIAEQFPVRVASINEARLSAMALFLDVARGSTRVGERRVWLAPYLAMDAMANYIATGLYAEDAYWTGDLAGAISAVKATIAATMMWDGSNHPQVIRPAAVGIAALADQARLARAGGQPADDLVAEAEALLVTARRGVNDTYKAAAAIGIDGHGWLARAEAEFQRATDHNAPENWRIVADTFGPAFVYEIARTRWRLAEALAEAGEREEAQHEWQLAAAAADELGAVRLRSALADLGRRARLGGGAATAAPTAGSPLSILTSRELEVLRSLASGRSNREIGAELFISDKTVSVHVSNILGKLGAASRTEAAAIAHDNGLRSRR